MDFLLRQMDKTAAAIGASFVINCGDNFYKGGSAHDGVTGTTDSQWQTVYENIYNGPYLSNPDIKWYSVLGNHDYGLAKSPLYEIQYSLQNLGTGRWYMPDHNFTVIKTIPNSGGATLQFVFFDTQRIAISETSNTMTGGVNPVTLAQCNAQLQWLASTLASSTATWLFVIGHYHGRWLV